MIMIMGHRKYEPKYAFRTSYQHQIALTIIGLVLTFSLVGSAHAFKAFNVNLNKTIDLPVQPLYPKTTLQPGYPSCANSTDALTAIKNIQKEKAQNPAMFKSDALLADQSSDSSSNSVVLLGRSMIAV
jgi:hypothetical protein